MDPIISNSIINQNFACDLLKCKGACCTIQGGVGAPLQESEIKFVKEFQELTLPLLNERSQEIIRQNKTIEKQNDNFVLHCIDNKDCVFVFYENNIAKCSFEKLYNENKINWKKPISCRLFPLRLRNNKLMFEPIDECADAVLKGELSDTTLSEFLKEDLYAAFGKDWYLTNVKESK
ncbi:MAG: DUF3109 family protein [Bacteroidetes bacterium]|nr:DUF3109 family protein [Bacteroidota bacterium]